MKASTLDAFAEAQLKALGIKVEPSKEDAVYAAILAYCKKHKKPAFAGEICKATGIKRGTLGGVTDKLVAERRIIKVGLGLYIPVVTK